MPIAPAASVTLVLERLNAGEREAWRELLQLVNDHLRAMARREMRGEPAGQTLQPTALVHELFLRLSTGSTPRFVDRGHFLGVAARAMRQILVERHRRRRAQRRGGGHSRVPLADVDRFRQTAIPRGATDVVEGLRVALEEMDARADLRRPARVVECLFARGLSLDATAARLGVSAATVSRDWRFARAWLLDRLTRVDPPR